MCGVTRQWGDTVRHNSQTSCLSTPLQLSRMTRQHIPRHQNGTAAHTETTGCHGETYLENRMAHCVTAHQTGHADLTQCGIWTVCLYSGGKTPHGIAETRLGATYRITEMVRPYVSKLKAQVLDDTTYRPISMKNMFNGSEKYHSVKTDGFPFVGNLQTSKQRSELTGMSNE